MAGIASTRAAPAIRAVTAATGDQPASKSPRAKVPEMPKAAEDASAIHTPRAELDMRGAAAVWAGESSGSGVCVIKYAIPSKSFRRVNGDPAEMEHLIQTIRLGLKHSQSASSFRTEL